MTDLLTASQQQQQQHHHVAPPPPPPPPSSSSSDRVEAAISLSNELFEAPSFTRATFLPSNTDSKELNNLQLETSHRSLTTLTKRSATQTLSLSPKDNTVLCTTPLTFTSSEVQHTCFSPDGKLQAVFRSNLGGKDGKKDGADGKKVIEIWEVLEGVKREEVEVTKVQGEWYFDTTFGQPTWHPNSTSLLYTAEAPKPSSSNPDNPLPEEQKFSYTPDFGETFTGRRYPSLFLLTLSTSSFNDLLLSPTSTSPHKATVHQLTNEKTFPTTSFGQGVFLPDLKPDGTPRVLATGYESLGDGRKLGAVYCANRRAAIYELVVEKTLKEEEASSPPTPTWTSNFAIPHSPLTRSSRSPRVLHPSPGATHAPLVVYLSNPLGGPHSSCASLHAAALLPDGSARTTILVDSVTKPKDLSSFPGLYVDQLPKQCFVKLEDGSPGVVMSSIWRSRKVPLVVGLKDGKVTSLAKWPEPKEEEEDVVLPYLEKEEELESFSVLGTDGRGRVVASRSGLKGLGKVVVLDLDEGLEKVEWKVVKIVKVSERVSTALSKVHYTILPLPNFGLSEIILVSPIPINPAAEAQHTNLPPLITVPHGGPHSTSTTDFSINVVGPVLAGYTVALVNYPGSLGFGQDFVEELPPSLGTLDVEATLAVGRWLEELSLASRTKGKRLIMGGSHGGWITAHLTARWKDEFDAAVMRNPVVDLGSNFTATDIPDWCYAEASTPYSFSKPPIIHSPTLYSHLHNISPLRSASSVITPTLLLIGKADRRVPPDQGRSWYHALKGNGTEVEMKVYPGNGHALDSDVETEVAGFASGLRWLGRFTVF